MSDKPLVSVVTIFLNAERYIEEAVESVFAQTWRHWELFLIDDGSTDGSAEIARRLAAANPGRVHYLEHPGRENRGMSASRNLGLRHARGDFIAFLDADDVWLPRKLEEQGMLLASQPRAGMVYGRTEYWYSWTGVAEDAVRDVVQRNGIEANVLYEPPELLTLFLREDAAIPCMGSVLVRSEIVQRIRGFEDAFRHLYEDQVFYAKACLEAAVYVSGDCWDRYRQHAQSNTALAERLGQSRLARAAYLNWLESHLLEQGLSYPALWQALRRAQWQQRHLTLARLGRGARRRVQWLRVHK